MRIKLPDVEEIRQMLLKYSRRMVFSHKQRLLSAVSWDIYIAHSKTKLSQDRIDSVSSVKLAFQTLVADGIVSVKPGDTIIVHRKEKFPTLVASYYGK